MFWLVRQTAFAYDKAVEWSERNEEFVKRGGFALMAGLGVSDKSAPDGKFMKVFSISGPGHDLAG